MSSTESNQVDFCKHGIAVGRRTAEECAEAAFLTSMYVGSIAGAVGGLVAAQSFVNGIYPVVFGAIGCMAGSSILCALSAWIWRRNIAEPQAHAKSDDHG